MDSLSQIVLGGAVAAAIAPARHRRAALLAGAVLGTLPDLDSLPLALLTDDPVARMTLHRSASHSLFVLPVLAWAIWAFLRRRGGRVAESPVRWFWAILLALVTHPVLDAFTVYGTQLWWPLPLRPVMWSSVFIIDPLYTIWLLAACIAAWWLRERIAAQRMLVAGLVLSTAYLGWSLLAKAAIDREADRALAALGLADAPRFSVPMPFNTLLWRVVAMTPQGFVEGERSLVADDGPMVFRGYPSNVEALRGARGIAAVQRLDWFNHGFQKAQVRDGVLVLSDLRMGAEPDYTFNFAVAERDGSAWRAIPPQQLRWPWQARRRLAAMWERIWMQPAVAQAAAGSPGDTPAASASK
jgi:inner membrane protein